VQLDKIVNQMRNACKKIVKSPGKLNIFKQKPQ